MSSFDFSNSRILLFIFVAVLLQFQLTGCSSESDEGELIVGIEAEPERFDPLTMKNPKNFIVSWQIYEGLFTLDATGKVTASIADRWETTDNVTWHVHVRDGVKFHASELFGSPAQTRTVTAQDVAASYTAFCSPRAYAAFLITDAIVGCADYNTGKAESVEGIRVVGDSTVEFRLIKPEPFFLNRLTTAWVAIFPHELMDPEYDESRGLDIAVGTGPYRMLSRTASEIVLEANPDHWDTSADGDITRLVFRVITNDEIRLAELDRGGIDLMILPPVLYPAVFDNGGSFKAEYSEKLRTLPYSTLNSHMIAINNELVSDVHLRRAMDFGTNRSLMVDKLLYDLADATVGTIPPGTNGYKPPFDVESHFSLQRAKEELALSDYSGEAIEMLVHEQAGSEQIGQLFQAQMKDVGIDIQLTKVDFNSAIGRMIQGDTPMISMFLDYVFSTPEALLLNFFASDKRPVPNFWQYSNAAIDREMESLRQMEQSVAIPESADIEKQIMEEAPSIFLYRLNQLAIYANRYGDITVNGHGHFEFDDLRLVETD